MSTTVRAQGETLLQALTRKRHLSRPQVIRVLEKRARDLGVEDFALSLRQLDRWLAGQVETLPRPSLCRVVEAEFGWPIERLLAPHRGAPLVGGPGEQHVRAEPRSALRTEELVAWLADHSGADFGNLWAAVAEGAARRDAIPPHELIAAARRHATVARGDIAERIRAWYDNPSGLYQGRVASTDLLTTIVTRPEWIELGVPLGAEAERTAAIAAESDVANVAGLGLDAAVCRLAGVEASDTVLVNDLLYRLRSVDFAEGGLAASFDLVDFAAFALTNDLLEEELLDSILAGAMGMPLRRLYLPSVESALDLPGRACVGGPVCLTAIARPQGDYALLVQRRSARVLNVPGRLAVIPKAFHQPMVDAAGESRLSTTVEREFEEELLGRLDLDVLGSGAGRKAAPLHQLSSSEPAAWLRSNPDSRRLECTGFGVNLVSGNYEFACLLAIEDVTWWERFGHLVEANWEAERLRCWSSRDPDGIERLVADPAWSNEGLFAFVEGVRRLSLLDPARVALPLVEVELS